MCAPQPLSSLSPYTTLFRSKYMQNSSLKIFALAACASALFLLSANIYQATFSVRKGLFLKSLKSILNWADESRSSALPFYQGRIEALHREGHCGRKKALRRSRSACIGMSSGKCGVSCAVQGLRES